MCWQQSSSRYDGDVAVVRCFGLTILTVLAALCANACSGPSRIERIHATGGPESLRALEARVAVDPYNLEARYHLALAYSEAGRVYEACRQFDFVISPPDRWRQLNGWLGKNRYRQKALEQKKRLGLGDCFRAVGDER